MSTMIIMISGTSYLYSHANPSNSLFFHINIPHYIFRSQYNVLSSPNHHTALVQDPLDHPFPLLLGLRHLEIGQRDHQSLLSFLYLFGLLCLPYVIVPHFVHHCRTATAFFCRLLSLSESPSHAALFDPIKKPIISQPNK